MAFCLLAMLIIDFYLELMLKAFDPLPSYKINMHGRKGKNFMKSMGVPQAMSQTSSLIVVSCCFP